MQGNFVRLGSMGKAIGACYVIRQSPGGERLGGLKITLFAPTKLGGSIEFKPTGMNNSTIGEDLGWLEKTARKAISDYASQHQLDLSSFHILVSEVAYHPTDSSDYLYYQATQSALRTALEAWSFRRFPPPTNP